MVTALAEVMSDYCFARTTKFIAVTGEEQGLYGSDHYADTAAAAGEDIQAVLNGDMIGWEGDGQPAVEDLDINYNSGSQWLAQAMVDAAADYGTGLAINAFSCSSMVYSDHAPFWSNGFSAVCGITDNEGFCSQTGNYPYYHQSSDTIANCGAGGPISRPPSSAPISPPWRISPNPSPEFPIHRPASTPRPTGPTASR